MAYCILFSLYNYNGSIWVSTKLMPNCNKLWISHQQKIITDSPDPNISQRG